MTKESTFGMIKPESIERGLEEEIIARIQKSGLEIVHKEKRALLPNEVKVLYGHIKERLPSIYEQMEKYLTTREVILLKVSGFDAIARLLELRGNSNAAEAKPGSIRGDYAKDQSYELLTKENKMAYNLFHAANSKEEVERANALLLDKNGK